MTGDRPLIASFRSRYTCGRRRRRGGGCASGMPWQQHAGRSAGATRQGGGSGRVLRAAARARPCLCAVVHVGHDMVKQRARLLCLRGCVLPLVARRLALLAVPAGALAAGGRAAARRARALRLSPREALGER